MERMGRPLLFVTRRLPDPVMDAIRGRFRLSAEPSADPPTREALAAGAREAEAMICTLTEAIDETLLEASPRLRVIANCAVGFNNVAVEAAKARGIVVTNTPDVLTDATADLTWALLLATARRIAEGHALVQSGEWRGWGPIQLLGTDLTGKTLGILGMGRIGQAVARRASGFEMTVLYHSRRPLRDPAHSRRWRSVTLDELLTLSDFLTLHLPLADDTRHIIGREQLRRMKPSAMLINTSRGPVVDEAALAEAVLEGSLGGAGLDVYEHEPSVHPGLMGLPQVVTLPHLGSATLATRTRMGMMCVENVEAVLAGRPAPNAV